MTREICPKCGIGHPELIKTDDLWSPKPVVKIVCTECGLSTGTYIDPDQAWIDWNATARVIRAGEACEKDPNNPYTEFAKEMSLLHEALKAEGFKDAMVDILAAMSPVVWDELNKKKEKEAWDEARHKLGERLMEKWKEEENERGTENQRTNV